MLTTLGFGLTIVGIVWILGGECSGVASIHPGAKQHPAACWRTLRCWLQVLVLVWGQA